MGTLYRATYAKKGKKLRRKTWMLRTREFGQETRISTGTHKRSEAERFRDTFERKNAARQQEHIEWERRQLHDLMLKVWRDDASFDKVESCVIGAYVAHRCRDTTQGTIRRELVIVKRLWALLMTTTGPLPPQPDLGGYRYPGDIEPAGIVWANERDVWIDTSPTARQWRAARRRRGGIPADDVAIADQIDAELDARDAQLGTEST